MLLRSTEPAYKQEQEGGKLAIFAGERGVGIIIIIIVVATFIPINQPQLQIVRDPGEERSERLRGHAGFWSHAGETIDPTVDLEAGCAPPALLAERVHCKKCRNVGAALKKICKNRFSRRKSKYPENEVEM